MIVQKLASVVGIDSEDRKGQALLDSFEGPANAVLATVPGRAHLGPSAVDVRRGERPEETPAHVATAVGDGVGLEPTGLFRIPALRPDRHKGFDCRVGFRRPPIDRAPIDFLGREDTINLSRTDLQNGLPGRNLEFAAMLFVERQPVPKHRHEPFSTGLLGVPPDFEKDTDDLRVVGFRPSPRSTESAVPDMASPT